MYRVILFYIISFIVYPFLVLFTSTFFFLSYILYGSHFVWCKMSHDFTIHDSQMMSWDIKSLELNLYSTIFPPISLRLIICKNKKFCILHSLFYSTTNICINQWTTVICTEYYFKPSTSKCTYIWYMYMFYLE